MAHSAAMSRSDLGFFFSILRPPSILVSMNGSSGSKFPALCCASAASILHSACGQRHILEACHILETRHANLAAAARVPWFPDSPSILYGLPIQKDDGLETRVLL